ncbi:MAG: tyrosine-type recombinase/integrase [Magnetococcus sp. YQC-3]
MNKMEIFLENLPKHTKVSYGTGLKKFKTWFENKYPGESIDDYIKDLRRLDNNAKLDATDRYEKDIKEWVAYLKTENGDRKQGYSGKTINTDIAALRGLLINNRIDLDKVFWKQLKNIAPADASLNEVIVSTPTELKEILTHSPDARAKAFFMTLATSGMRIGELCSLNMDEIKLNYQCPRITLPPSKVKNKKHRLNTRITPEAKTVLLEYLKVRDDNIRRAYQRSVNVGRLKPLTDEEMKKYIANEKRLFPFGVHTMEGIWNRMLKKSKYEEKDTSGLDERLKRNVHSLRKFFRTNFSKYNKNLAVYFMNQISDLEETYDHKTEEWIDEEYLTGSQYLAIFESPQDHSEKLNKLAEQNEEKDKQIQDMQSKLSDMEKQIQILLKIEEHDKLLEQLNGKKKKKIKS